MYRLPDAISGQVFITRKPILRWFVVIGLILAIPLCLIVAQWTRNKLLYDLNDHATYELKVNLAYLQSRLDHLETMTRIVAGDERVKALLAHPDDGNLTTNVNYSLTRLDMALGSITYLLNSSGKVIAAGNWDTPESLVGHDLSFRTYFKSAIAGLTGRYAAIGVHSGKLGYFIAEPIHLEGKITGVAVIKTDPQDLILPYHRNERAFIITDRNGIAIVSSPGGFLYNAITPLTPNAIDAIKSERIFSDRTIHPMSTVPVETIGNIRIITLTPKAASHFQPASREFVLVEADLPVAGWQAHILWPIHDLNANLVQSMLITILVLVVTLLLALFTAERWRHMKSIHEQAIRDPLTGLYTRLYMTASVNQLLASHDRGNITGVGVILFDLDHFKAVNDQYGHAAGDNVLVKVAEVIRRACRESDIAVRYGGEELLIFVPTGDTRQVLQLAQRIREQIKALNIYWNGRQVPITISGGIATHLPGQPLEKLIDKADQMMYNAKQNGRDQIGWT